jgi:hypothetical protein
VSRASELSLLGAGRVPPAKRPSGERRETRPGRESGDLPEKGGALWELHGFPMISVVGVKEAGPLGICSGLFDRNKVFREWGA